MFDDTTNKGRVLLSKRGSMQFVSSIIHVFIILREQRGQGVSNEHIKRMMYHWCWQLQSHGGMEKLVMPFNCMTKGKSRWAMDFIFVSRSQYAGPSDIQGRNIHSRYTAELTVWLHVRLLWKRENYTEVMKVHRNWRNNGQIPLVNLMHGKGPIYVQLHCTVMARRAPLLFAQIFLSLTTYFITIKILWAKRKWR